METFSFTGGAAEMSSTDRNIAFDPTLKSRNARRSHVEAAQRPGEDRDPRRGNRAAWDDARPRTYSTRRTHSERSTLRSTDQSQLSIRVCHRIAGATCTDTGQHRVAYID